MVDPVSLIILEELEDWKRRARKKRTITYEKVLEVSGSYSPEIFPISGEGVLKRMIVSSSKPFGLVLDVDGETVIGDFNKLVDLKDEYSNITAYIKNNMYYLIVEDTEFYRGINATLDFGQKSRVRMDIVVIVYGGGNT